MTIRAARPLLRRISVLGPINPYAVAFILTEMTFRGPIFRTIELCYSAMLIFIARREPSITVGHSQVSFEFWRYRFGHRSFALLLGTLSVATSYEVCCLYLEAHKQHHSLRELMICYNGKPSKLYARRFMENLRAVQSLTASMRVQTAFPFSLS